ncbi:MAG TPA: alkaline phosphatase family protein [Actinomycetota bacterium]|nr:alkaline phosphatase family protein [Actinomycetota bacterium]
MNRAVVIGLDGAAWHLLQPLMEKGVMPRLARLRAEGADGILRSTVPTYTPPAWTSAFTGVNPGRHGIYGFIAGHAQHRSPQLVHSGLIKAPAIWRMANEQGARAGIYNVPITFPPRPIDGWMVSGMMTPGYDAHRSGFASWDRGSNADDLERRILEWAPDYVLDLHANYETDWRDAALAERAIASLRQRHRVLSELLELDPPDVIFSVLETPDRLQHVYYRYIDPADDMYGSPGAMAVRGALERCFKAIDDIVGLLHDYAGEDGGVLVCSDHGFTAWEVSVHLNALLERWGYLKLKGAGKLMQSGVARALVPVAKKVLPRKVARDAKGATFAAIDWAATRAFASPIPQQGIFVNLKGRDEFGTVEASDLGSIKDEIAQRFIDLAGPDGAPVTDKVYRSEEVFQGDAVDGAPDLLPVLRDHRFELDDELFHREPYTDVSHLPRGVHHPDGIIVVAGTGVDADGAVEGSVMDVTPTLLYQAGLDVPDGLDGSVLTNAFTRDRLEQNPLRIGSRVDAERGDEASPYSADEEALIEESLRGLGYL